jgi:hypothetical protein
MAPRIKSKITTKDNRKKFDSIISNIQKIRPSYVKVGFPMNDPKTNQAHHEANSTGDGSKAGDNSPWSPEISAKATVLEIAVYHEFGAPGAGLEERSFMRTSHDLNTVKYQKLQIYLFGKLIDGVIGLDQALDIAGQMIQTDIKKFLTDGKVKPPSQRAIDEGGKTLIDTAQMLNSITYKKFKGGTRSKDFGIFTKKGAKSRATNIKGFKK